MQWNATYSESVHSFANNINTHEGGSHLSGFRAALTRTINAYARASGALKEKDENLLGEDMVEGLAAIISVKLREPQFEGQTKTKLGNPSIKGVVETAMNSMLVAVPRGAPERREGDRHEGRRGRPCAPGRPQGPRPDAAQDRARLDAAARASSPTARSRDPAQCELYLVEGNSAGGSAVDARNREFQAILPLRGKIINVEKARLAKVLSNQEIQSIIMAIGANIGEDFDLGLRALPQDRRDDGRGRRRRAHPHADPDVLLPPHARSRRRGLRVHRAAAALPHQDRPQRALREERRGAREAPAHREARTDLDHRSLRQPAGLHRDPSRALRRRPARVRRLGGAPACRVRRAGR